VPSKWLSPWNRLVQLRNPMPVGVPHFSLPLREVGFSDPKLGKGEPAPPGTKLACYKVRIISDPNFMFRPGDNIDGKFRVDGLCSESEAAPHTEKARALQLAIKAADYMNRFAAMDTCRAIITAMHDEGLGLQVARSFLNSEIRSSPALSPANVAATRLRRRSARFNSSRGRRSLEALQTQSTLNSAGFSAESQPWNARNIHSPSM
jgi:hypothetical protein